MVAAIVSPAMIARFRLGALLFVALLLQTTVAADLRIRGVSPDFMILVTICAGLAGGADTGAMVCFVAGLLIDLFLHATPFGLSALTYCLVGYGVGVLRRTVLHEGWFLAPGTALVGSAVGVVLFVLVGVMVGQHQLTAPGPKGIAQIAGIVGGINAILAVPVARIVSWAGGGLSGHAASSGAAFTP
ncbi:MAG TPA: rod shape-determining protein MreD [Acidimicrobiales bacterium]|nr:rod shape-determining protein MreD [Acidimicrobiales bacterium]